MRTANRVQPYGTTIFTEMTALANEYQAVNLGQGFPDFPAPDFIKEAARAAIDADHNQYAHMPGIARLRQAIANKVRRHYGLDVNPETEITVTHGATEGIFATILGLVDPGDEVIMFEPVYDSYFPAVTMSGGMPVTYPLRAPDFNFDPDALEALFTDRTKAILINTPHNPIGKVFTREELDTIARLCQKYDVLAITDEVYEHIVFDEARHLPLINFPGMRERTIMISSIGKTFSVTGWKLGWAIAAPDLSSGVRRTHQFMTFCGNPATQLAAAEALEVADGQGYYEWLQQMYLEKRDFLERALADAGIPAFTPKGTYFIMADIRGLGFADDVAFCRYLTTEVGVAAIPPSAFYSNPADGATVARFCFCKTESLLEEAARRLRLIG